MLLVFIAALFWDLILGEPPIYIHPVVLTGKISEKLIRPYKGYVYGIFIWLLSVVPILILFILPLYIPILILKFILLALTLKTTFSIKMLYKIVNKSSNLDENSRYIVQQIVRRNLTKEDEGHIASAAIESLFESFVDGISSPLFWFLLLGMPGALLQRLSNTMDSMVGYKTTELKKEGFFSAKVDTILNYIPARISVLFMILAGIIMRLKVKNMLDIIRHSDIESINARYPISAAAYLLGVKLEKRGFYSVGNGNLPSSSDIKRALKLFKITTFLYISSILVIYYCFYGFSFFGFPYGLIKFL
ncbi:cobalamin biosynthesis protein [Acidianus brierleyi]|uniref:Probable cobalamin biosynthesis protein CobD n=1 Tax=Acidianus brierleyi TaxID=41673 RepID=A0A2U9IE51_9CREN|nr:cobalamin biosynthesis protein [Acidianus brierleyi]AWR94285.1 cobalamin biosynthesis protein [Acidianus brierleyi]